MALESATYINGLVTSNPTATDALAQADDHLRLIKATIKATFPNITGAVTATHTSLNQDPTTLIDSNGATRVAATTSGATVTGNLSISGNISVTGDGIALGTDTSGNYVAGITGGTGVTVANSGSEGATPTVSIGQAVATSDTVTFAEVRSTGNVTAYYSDERLKTDINPITDAVSKVENLRGFYFKPNQKALDLGYEDKVEVGVSAQDIEKVLPEIIAEAPIDPTYMTVHYEKIVPLLIEAIKELKNDIDRLESKGCSCGSSE
tara:strand:+ start:3684 stop:4475 length:792 start_codon:yes stop_codon:yes gene_type:complete